MDLNKIGDLAQALAKAAEMGMSDAMHGGPKRGKTAREILEKMGARRWRNGHLRAVKMAYSAGQFNHQTAENNS